MRFWFFGFLRGKKRLVGFKTNLFLRSLAFYNCVVCILKNYIYTYIYIIVIYTYIRIYTYIYVYIHTHIQYINE